MEGKNMIVGIVSLAVVVICVAAIMMPILSEYTTAEKTYTNEGMPFAAPDDDSHTIVIASGSLTVDGETIDTSLFPGSFTWYTIVYGENAFVRLTINELVIQYVDSTATSFSYNGETVTISISGDSGTITTTADDTTATISDILYYISSEGEYVMSLNPYVTSETQIYGAGTTSFTTPPTYIATIWSGTIESVTAAVIRATNSVTATVSSTEVNTTVIENNLVRIDSVLINYDATYSDTDYELTSTYTYFLAPAEVTYTPAAYLGSGNAALIMAMPVLVLVGLLLSTIGMMVVRRD